jgi:hypothetical protein
MVNSAVDMRRFAVLAEARDLGGPGDTRGDVAGTHATARLLIRRIVGGKPLLPTIVPKYAMLTRFGACRCSRRF